MKVTYQHRVVARHLHGAYGHIRDWPFSSPEEIERELSRQEVHLGPGDYLVVDAQGGANGIGKAAGLLCLSAYGKQSLVIPYSELERAFHEQHADWAEL